MNLSVQKRLAAQVLKCSPKRVVFDSTKLGTIKEALTRADIKDLINSKAVVKNQETNISQSRTRKLKIQKRKGLRKGLGSRKGTAKARLSPKESWMIKVRLQRTFLRELREKKKITVETYRKCYNKISGNFFRNKRHIKLYLEEQKLFTESQ